MSAPEGLPQARSCEQAVAEAEAAGVLAALVGEDVDERAQLLASQAARRRLCPLPCYLHEPCASPMDAHSAHAQLVS